MRAPLRHAVLLSAALPVLVGAQEPVFRSRSDVVTVQVAVHRGSRPMRGLEAADFRLADNGVAQEIRSVSAEQVPIDLTLLLDLSGSVNGKTLERLESAIRDTTGELRDDDRVRLLTVSHVLREVSDFQSPRRPMPLETLTAGGATSLYDGLAAAMMRPSDPGRRQLIVAFTDGRDSTSIIDEALAEDLARRTDALVDIVVPVTGAAPGGGPVSTTSTARVGGGGPGIDMMGRVLGAASQQGPGSSETGPAALRDLTAPTAGEVLRLEAGASISGVFKRLLDDFRASYLLQYIPKGVPAAGWHDLTVTVTRPGQYEVRARRGYAG